MSHSSNFALLNVLIKNKVNGWWIGPDNLKIDSHGNMYVAQLFCSRVLKISPAGKPSQRTESDESSSTRSGHANPLSCAAIAPSRYDYDPGGR